MQKDNVVKINDISEEGKRLGELILEIRDVFILSMTAQAEHSRIIKEKFNEIGEIARQQIEKSDKQKKQ